MRKLVYFALLALIAVNEVFTATVFAEVPREIADFALQANISQYKDRVEQSSALPVRDMEYLTEVDVVAPPGFKSGQLTYGNCAHPGRIVKISMKYLNPDKDFFDKLLVRFKQRYGDPAEWRGDPFHVYVAWKWSFVDENNNRISMIIQHYSGDEDVYKNGNSVKLSMFGLIEEEEKCYEKKHPAAATERASNEKPRRQTEVDFQDFIPKP